jgi:hypothetical protein
VHPFAMLWWMDNYRFLGKLHTYEFGCAVTFIIPVKFGVGGNDSLGSRILI